MKAYEVLLKRKPTQSPVQNARARVERVAAVNAEEAKKSALAINNNGKYFNVERVREFR